MSFGKAEHYPHPLSIGPQERIAYHGNLTKLLKKIVLSYGSGSYTGHEIKQNGYEDFNLVLDTSKGRSFAKCFASWRNPQECIRYLEMIQTAISQGHVRTPSIYPNLKNSALTTISINSVSVNLCLMQYLDGGNIWESGHPLTVGEQEIVIKEAAKINNCDYKPTVVKDSWAIINIAETYLNQRGRIDPADRALIELLLDKLKQLDLATLPHAFVHGDIRSTNVMRHSDGKVYVIDFSVANWYPRIVELAVICSDLLFDPQRPGDFQHKYPWALDQYRRAGVMLTPVELETLPLFVKLAHVANIVGASSVDATNNISVAENNHWLNLGKRGLQFATIGWNPNYH